MKVIDLNQFQSYYDINKTKGVIIDFLLPKIEYINKGYNSIIINEIYNNDYEILDHKLRNRLNTINNHNLEIVLVPSYNCNMNCIYCYEGEIRNNTKSLTEADVEPIIRTISNIIEQDNIKKLNFTLMGGEPIIKENFNFYDVFFNKAKQKLGKFKVTCISNGLEIIDYFYKLLEYGVESYQITIDGDEKTHNKRRKTKNSINGFENISNSIDQILKHNLNLEIRVNIDSNNIISLIELSNFILKKKWLEKNCSIYIYPISENGCNSNLCYLPEVDILGKTIEIFKTYSYCLYNLRFHGLPFIDSLLNNKLPKIHKYFCSANINQYVFDPFGNVYTCWWGISKKDFFKLVREKLNIMK
ncbi:MAG: radical SAM protein [Exilispira sp.]|jgi:uncharacterized protein|nr:radical SAM protein [Exilispira sp.]